MERNEHLIVHSDRDKTGSMVPESVVGHVVYERFLIERDVTGSAGRGRFQAYIAKDLTNYCRKVVLRTLNEPLAGPDADSPSYGQICGVLSVIGHPGVEEILESGKLFDGRPYSTTNIVEGERLASVLRGGKRFTIEQTARVIEALYEALAAVHERNILHCAVDPTNIVVSDFDEPSERVRLINFGTAWPIGICESVYGRALSEDDPLYFAAPEALAKLGHRSTTSDVYSLAALAYRMLGGNVPFREADRESLLAAIDAGKTEPLSNLRTDISCEAEKLILSGLNFEPAWRPQNAGDYGSRLVLALRRSPIVVREEVTDEAVTPAADTSPDRLNIETKTLTTETFDKPAETPEKRLMRIPGRNATPLSDRAITWSLIVLLLAGALSIPVGQMFLSGETKAAAVGSMVTKAPENNVKRRLKYSMEQRATTGTRVQAAASSSSRRLLTMVPDNAGELYVIEEFSGDAVPLGFRFAYPKSGSAATEAGKMLRVELDTPIETIAVWIVWTADKNVEFESFRQGLERNDPANENARNLKHFLERNRNLRVEVSSDEATGQTILTGNAEKIVHRVALQPDVSLTAQK